MHHTHGHSHNCICMQQQLQRQRCMNGIPLERRCKTIQRLASAGPHDAISERILMRTKMKEKNKNKNYKKT